MQDTITRDGIVDSMVDLLINARRNDQDVYLVYCEADPDFTVELDDGSIIMRVKGVQVKYSDETVDRMLPILSAPVFDYKSIPVPTPVARFKLNDQHDLIVRRTDDSTAWDNGLTVTCETCSISATASKAVIFAYQNGIFRMTIDGANFKRQ